MRINLNRQPALQIWTIRRLGLLRLRLASQPPSSPSTFPSPSPRLSYPSLTPRTPTPETNAPSPPTKAPLPPRTKAVSYPGHPHPLYLTPSFLLNFYHHHFYSISWFYSSKKKTLVSLFRNFSIRRIDRLFKMIFFFFQKYSLHSAVQRSVQRRLLLVDNISQVCFQKLLVGYKRTLI